MLPAKYKPNRSVGSGVEVICEWFLPCMGMAAILNF